MLYLHLIREGYAPAWLGLSSTSPSQRQWKRLKSSPDASCPIDGDGEAGDMAGLGCPVARPRPEIWAGGIVTGALLPLSQAVLGAIINC